jgi:APA family basic amino acid/polyamine antiporter
VMYLRYARPEMKRPFRTPLFPVVPILGVLMCLLLLLSLMANHDTRNFFLFYLVGGIVLYFAYGMWKSKLRQGVVVEGHEAEPMELPHAGE